MSISETTLNRIIDTGERADDIVRRVGRVSRDVKPVPTARALGWFGIGLGLAEALMPKTMARAIGAEGYDAIVCAFGLREIGTGIAILSEERPSPEALWARVGGDALDLAFLGLAAGSNRNNGGRVAFAAAMVAGALVADIACARRLAAER